MSNQRFQHLGVEQLAEKLATEIWKIVNNWHSSSTQQDLFNQINSF